MGGLARGEGSEEEQRSGKLISSWAYTAKPGDTSVECLAVNQEGKVESSASIAFVVKDEQVVTLRNIEDKRKMENNNDVRKTASVEDNLDKLQVEKEDADAVDTIDVADVDAVEKLAGFAAADPKEQFFDAGRQHFFQINWKDRYVHQSIFLDKLSQVRKRWRPLIRRLGTGAQAGTRWRWWRVP